MASTLNACGHIWSLSTHDLRVDGECSAVTFGAAAGPGREESDRFKSTPKPEQEDAHTTGEGGATCIACGIGIHLPGFDSAADQREHFKTDWHRYNLKRRLRHQPPATEEQFESLIENQDDGVSSISGSSSESDLDDDDVTSGAPGTKITAASLASSQRPQYIFKASDERLYAVWRCLLCQDHALRGATAAAMADSSAQLRSLSQLVTATTPPLWVIIMLRGGHFAAAVLRARVPVPGSRTLGAPLAPNATASNRQQAPADMPFEVVDHKTFHRYVVRAKAGGKQSTKDGTGKFARSAGSRLRRYNELALERDIGELLTAWTQHLAAAQLIFVHAPSSNNKTVFGASPGGVGTGPLVATDPRVRRVPFMTQRPTFSEVKRVARLLSTVFHVPPEQLQQPSNATEAAVDDTGKEARRNADPSKAPVLELKLTEPPRAQHHDEPIVSQNTGQTAVQGHTMPLHRAAKSGDPDRVNQLLEAGHDPTQQDEKGRTPYILSADKAVRDAFRRYMAKEPEKWDYTAADIPSALTHDMEAAQLAKKAEKKAKLKEREKERKLLDEEKKKKAAEAAAAAVDDEISRAAAEAAALSARLGNMRVQEAGTSKVGGTGPVRASGSASQSAQRTNSAPKGLAVKAKAPSQQRPQQQQAQQRQPTPEEMARRREMMAAAAEARMQALQQQAQQQQLW